MKKILILTIISTILFSCNRNSKIYKSERTIGIVTIENYKITSTGNVSEKAIKIGLKDAMNILFANYKTAINKNINLEGTFNCTFRIEANGHIRMALEGNNTLSKKGYDLIVSKFIRLTMAQKWKFPKLGNPSMVETLISLKKY